jgi:hypothetical protein
MEKPARQHSIGRRSRFRRVPKGRQLALTERDLAILQSLYRYRYLRATRLVEMLRPKSEKRFIERRGDLYHEAGLIDRLAAQWRRFDARYPPIVYELSTRGASLLERQGELPQRAVTFSVGGKRSPAQQFEHAMMIVDAMVTKKCFGYVRVSTVKQGEGVSLEAQRDAIVAFAARSDITIIKWFEEKVTAAKSGRLFNAKEGWERMSPTCSAA